MNFRKTNENNGLSHYVHAILSFLVSTLRGCFLCLCSVRIYENSKLPKRTLYDIPQQSYCKEVGFVYTVFFWGGGEIFINEIAEFKSNNLCLGRFFYATNTNGSRWTYREPYVFND